VSVIVEGADDRSIVKVVAPDEHGLLATICRYFQSHKVNIESLQARSRHGVARDTFLVIGTVDAEDLKTHLASSSDSRSVPTVA
jgi:glycine cleavage system regulatory protein